MAESTKAMDQAMGAIASREGKYLTFKIASEHYGIEILKIKEIIGMMPITSLPKTPGFVKGVINLRGRFIPVVDLRTKFGLEQAEVTDETCIIVVDVSDTQTGIFVDTVDEVLDIGSAEIEDAPDFGAGMATEYILGVAKMETDVKILLDIDRVLSSSDLNLLGSISNTDKVEDGVNLNLEDNES